ncbi:DUF4225 domain-containing protein [Kosakonia radicincitans]|uniref:DUF4225 domain-containing protein n=1 Tax=Kosakonia radicincitans TaxID=283686 RepID=UPI0005C323F3|nr:DUF4225 domain-containing protein [Kosakonia radicincitans]KIS42025.1 hypothetical protein LG58_3355 [Kosakonia radicincitans YD4]
MDIALFPGQRGRAWVETMINLEARKLINTANIVGGDHLKDGLSRIRFMEDIKSFVMQQFSETRAARSDDECMQCLKNIRAENDSLLEQSRMLRTRSAQLYAKVELIKENNKIVGYMISAVKVVLAGVQISVGVAAMMTMMPVGMLAGAILVIDGANDISREINRQFMGVPDSEGMVADGVMDVAQFMGFRRESGLGIYNSVGLAASVTTVFGAIRKPEAWRLFRWLPLDFYRTVDGMTRAKLTMKILGWGVSAKVVFELMSNAPEKN